ncbi:hypothetical protein Q2T42_02755 [Leptolyngbya boryana CZ1]|jgi:hypothetical protein|uniref:Uncharacterized protein n=2 Tax=Leptolyngbya boryana TaxID=1184 RepID=A0A1Z4JKQ3_LEPBY|nr:MULTISPECIES: Npun_F0494 family protein [Leptolyngbya]BAY57296.1 hypothetical protein NIES2135_41610 [Leptolyngbya boryana NIES-2135]MBD1857461.1 hypothetical protein [Leptolyngbya sp. FACHB-1624]MBD2366953.1 hypothetical protein [Leptolyngbya sp. FACHB-161]MBD2373693.1 hypothetical protein [Leptolyngbya sp. FACHB-238]MBD2398102.1 hypothetical protein [Leptolyngbya sp. FACHB-239]
MTPTTPNPVFRHPQKTLDRAARAVRCAPFRLKLYALMLDQSVALSALIGIPGTRNQLTKRMLSELSADGEMLWLIQVGLLRREVDGQGLTDRFRLTPLGRQLVSQWQSVGGFGKANLRDRILNTLNRWLRLPV